MDKGEILKKAARPTGTLLCVLTLCILAIAEGVGAADVPTWALGILGSIAGEWIVERGVSKAKGDE